MDQRSFVFASYLLGRVCDGPYFVPSQMRTKKIANELKVLTLGNEYFNPFQRQHSLTVKRTHRGYSWEFLVVPRVKKLSESGSISVIILSRLT